MKLYFLQEHGGATAVSPSAEVVQALQDETFRPRASRHPTDMLIQTQLAHDDDDDDDRVLIVSSPDVRLGDVDVEGRQPVNDCLPSEAEAVPDHVRGRRAGLEVSRVQLEHLVHQDLSPFHVRLSNGVVEMERCVHVM